MKTAIQSITLAIFVFSTGVANSHNTLVDEYGNQIKGVVYATCEMGSSEGRQFSRVSAVDRSHDQIPAPRKESTCAEYTTELIKSGAQVNASQTPCGGGINDMLPGGPDRLCLFVMVALYAPIPW